jgi:hypothetical protein
MVWQFIILTALSIMYVIHVFLKVDAQAALSGFFIVLLALCMELINQQIGPYWIAQGSVYLITSGLPIEKLLLYWVGGTFVCVNLTKPAQLAVMKGVSNRWFMIVGIAVIGTVLELFLNLTEVFRWVRPWTMAGAFIYYLAGAHSLFRFYAASHRTKMAAYGALTITVIILALMTFTSKPIFPLARTAAPH